MSRTISREFDRDCERGNITRTLGMRTVDGVSWIIAIDRENRIQAYPDDQFSSRFGLLAQEIRHFDDKLWNES